MVSMVNPFDITKFDRTYAELQEFLLFCIMVAGHNSMTTKAALERLMDETVCFVQYGNLIFSELNKLDDDTLVEVLTDARTGKYCLLSKAIRYVGKHYSYVPLDSLSIGELVEIPGVGPKTARFFVLHSRPNARVAVLDVHVLRWLKEQGYLYVRTQTPQAESTYKRIEGYFLEEADKRGLEPYKLDTLIWSNAVKVYDDMKERQVS